MPTQPLFSGLVFDEIGNPVGVTYVGSEPCYIVNDSGFQRHIPSEQVDRQVLNMMKEQIEGHEDLLTEQTAKMLGQDDIFSRAIIENQLKNIDQQMENILQTGLPEEGRAYMGMMGFKIIINFHGDVVKVEQPGMIANDEDGDE
jgi:hypothetical protein